MLEVDHVSTMDITIGTDVDIDIHIDITRTTNAKESSSSRYMLSRVEPVPAVARTVLLRNKCSAEHLHGG